jgi:NAD+ kinase
VIDENSEITVEVVSGRDASANFDIQSLTSLQHGDRVVVQRSEHQVRFLHPLGWTYFDTLRQKLHWNEGVS